MLRFSLQLTVRNKKWLKAARCLLQDLVAAQLVKIFLILMEMEDWLPNDYRLINVSHRTLSRASLIWHHLFKPCLFKIYIISIFKMILQPRTHRSSQFSCVLCTTIISSTLMYSTQQYKKSTNYTHVDPPASHSLVLHFLMAQYFPKNFILSLQYMRPHQLRLKMKVYVHTK